MSQILVVEPDVQQREIYENLLWKAGFRIKLALDLAEVRAALDQSLPQLVILDLDHPQTGGLETLRELVQDHGVCPVIVTSSQGSTEEAIGAIKLGAFDYVLRPWDGREMLKLVREGLEAGRFSRTTVTVDGDGPAREGEEMLIGRSRPMQEIYKAVGRVAPTDATVLIRGESGTGKELVARAIYQHSARVGKPFVVVNCVAIPETLLESELFGHEKGAFTGAMSRRLGKIELGQGGTVFLDEVGDMPLGIQAKLLRLLQDRKIERIGGREPIKVDVRIIAATNRNLEAAINEGRFREDLFYRLNVVPIALPPLRQRPSDVPRLADYFLARFARNLGVRNPGLTEQARRLLTHHDWPGNVRELSNALEQCLIFSRGRPIGAAEVNSLVLGKVDLGSAAPGSPDQILRGWATRELARGGDNLLSGMLEHLTRLVLEEALKLTQGNRTRAATLLGMSRPTLLAKMDKLGLRQLIP